MTSDGTPNESSNLVLSDSDLDELSGGITVYELTGIGPPGGAGPQSTLPILQNRPIENPDLWF